MKLKRKVQIRRAKPDYIIIGIAFLLFCIGMVTLLSASAPKALAEGGSSYVYFRNQLIYAIIGTIFATIVYVIDYRRFNNKKLLTILFFAMVAISIAVKYFGRESKGAIRWIKIAGISVQPSEVVKVGMIYVTAGYLSHVFEKGEIKKGIKSVVIPLFMLGLISGVIFKFQNHLSAALLIVMTGLIQMFVAGVNFIYYTGILGASAIMGGIFAKVKLAGAADSFRGERIKVWLNPFEYMKTTGWQTVQSLYALASGGLFGTGIGESKQKQSYIPEPQNDFIFAIFAEEMGFIGVLLIMAIFLYLIIRGVLIAKNAPDLFGKLLAIGTISMLGIQVCMNLAVVSNTIPVTGVSLPFFSYGGSAMVMTIVQIGLLANISKVGNSVKNARENKGI